MQASAARASGPPIPPNPPAPAASTAGVPSAAPDPAPRPALPAGVPPSRIIFAHPCKRPCDIRFARENGISLTTFDTESELHKMAALNPAFRWAAPRARAPAPLLPPRPLPRPHPYPGPLVSPPPLPRSARPATSAAAGWVPGGSSSWRRGGAAADAPAAAAPARRCVLRIRADDPDARVPLGLKYGCNPEEGPRLLSIAKSLGLQVGDGPCCARAFRPCSARATALYACEPPSAPPPLHPTQPNPTPLPTPPPAGGGRVVPRGLGLQEPGHLHGGHRDGARDV
jgi:hypothetical protein